MSAETIGIMTFSKGRRFEVVAHDLLAEPTEAIVNAANGGLAHGGGVAAAISRAAGSELDRECARLVQENGRVPTGGAVVTSAGNLPFKGVIHAVGPRMGEGDEEDKLIRALRSSFLIAHERGWASISFPGVSSGIFSVPHEICARAYVKAVESFWQDHPESPLKLIRLALFAGPLLEEVRRHLSGAAGRSS